MKIVVDTNVLVSATISERGTSEAVLSRALDRHAIILSGYILEEFKNILLKKLNYPIADVEASMSFWKTKAVIFDIVPNQKINFGDQKDIPILSLLETAQAHYLITGDKKLLALKKFVITLILTPREAMDIL